MNFSSFLHYLDRHIVTKQPVSRQIIRFQNRKEFQSCLRQLKKLKPSLSKLSHVQPIGIIHAISCPIQSSKNIMKHPAIRFIEKDTKIKMHSPTTFNPVHVPTDELTPSIPWGVKEIKAPQVWKFTKGDGIKVSVIDTGVDFNHPDLKEQLQRGFNFIYPHMPPWDDNGHGTHIAGTIAASNEENGIVGAAPKALLHPIKAFDHRGTAYSSDIIQAIEWSIRNQMDIINMSFGMSNRSQSLLDAIKQANDLGIITVASSGNDGKKETIDYPARFTPTISVGASSSKKRLASFSNRGKNIDIYAPGEKIFSTWPNRKYVELNGTSMATSHVSGIIALMLSINRDLSPVKIKTILKKTGTPLGSTNKKMIAKEINAVKALRYVKKLKLTNHKSKK
ncbi:S8 family peptidase [Chengkuizengella axinellae]|uniref:S8 family peptidase n=1 Tax=Chengkuizengella axinellae TaxID=3064388 RepID=A0ABT9IZ62_9BACL|nr:S8 family peptidase [Chengkuizengella sp. 2205SS18-9]MDP5274666.1 S8 family peptidase [Chengkuizengella sp. 2205SS18-9]